MKKGLRQLERLEPMVLQPLRGIDGDDWHNAPAGKWSLAQILSHLAIGVDSVGVAFEDRRDKAGMKRRATPRQSVMRHLMLGIGRLPPALEAPTVTQPAERPEPQLVTAQFRIGVERLKALVDQWPTDRQLNVFVRHPFLGDLNLPEWVRFHYVHCRHHAPQLQSRLRWLERR